jgi:protein SCO1/2
MNSLSRRNMLSLAALAPLAGTVSAGKPSKSAPSSLDPAQQLARKRVQELHLPNVPLLTHEGRKVRFYDDLLKDKIVSLNFFYSNCDEVCPVVMPNLSKVQKLLGAKVGREIFMYSVTLKPEEDTVSVIRDYRKKLHAGAGWTFFTGKPEDIESVRKGIGFSYPDPKIDGDKTQHIGNVRYGNEALMLWAACPGMAHAEWIAESFNWMIHPELSRVQLDSPTSRPKDAHAHDEEHMHEVAGKQ